MEAWLSDVKQIRIPRPKFGVSNSPTRNSRMPRDPPRDYNTGDESGSANRKHQSDTEELRQSLQEKL